MLQNFRYIAVNAWQNWIEAFVDYECFNGYSGIIAKTRNFANVLTVNEVSVSQNRR